MPKIFLTEEKIFVYKLSADFKLKQILYLPLANKDVPDVWMHILLICSEFSV